MKLKDMRFKVKSKGKEFIFGWKDIFGYEGEDCGVFVNLHDQGSGDITLTHNSGYGFHGINEDLEIEVFEEQSKENE